MNAQPLRSSDSGAPLPARVGSPDDRCEGAPLLSSLTDRQRERLLLREQIVIDAQRHVAAAARRGVGKLEALREFAAAVRGRPGACSAARLRKLIARYERDGLAALLDGRGRPASAGADHCSPDAWLRFKQLYLDPRRRSAQLCWEIVRAEADKLGWAWPALHTVRRRMDAEIDASTRDFHRLGEKRWRARHAPRIERDFTVYRPGEMWCGDHHEFDLLCLHRGRPIRPWLTAWMDMRTRLFVGWHIAPSPDSDTILAAFRAGVLEHGAPLRILIDNGKDYRSRAIAGGKRRKAPVDEPRVRSICAQLGIEPHFTQTYSGESKPIERAFKTVCDRFSKLFPTYTGGGPDTRPETLYADLRAERLDLPDLEEVARLFAQWVEQHYHLRPHTGDGMDGRCPLDVWASEEPIARRTAPREVLDLLLCRTEIVKVTRRGVRYDGICYGQDDVRVARLIGRRVMLRIDPTLRDRVHVCDLEGRWITTAFNRRLTGATAEEVKAGMRRQRAARRRAKEALPALRDAGRDTVEHVIAVQRQRLAAQRTGTDDVDRPVAPLPGATEIAASLRARSTQCSASSGDGARGATGGFGPERPPGLGVVCGDVGAAPPPDDDRELRVSPRDDRDMETDDTDVVLESHTDDPHPDSDDWVVLPAADGDDAGDDSPCGPEIALGEAP